MVIALYILLVLQILSAVFLFFITVTNSWITAIIILFVSVLQCVLTIVVIDTKNRIEALELNQNTIFTKLKKIESNDGELFNEESRQAPRTENRYTAIGNWECIKCGTINKIGSSFCQNCKADYSPNINPTVDPNAKKKRISRWIKYK